MKKYYVEEMDNLKEIRSFEEFGHELEIDDDGEYMTNKDEYDWWQELANSMEYIKDNDVEIDYINEYQDFIDIARGQKKD